MHNLYFILILLFFGCVSPTRTSTKRMTLKQLENQITEQFKQTPGDFALAFKNLSSPEEQMLINSKENFHAASTMKTPVMMEVYKQASAGKFSLSDSILVKNEFKSIVDGSFYSMEIGEESGEKLYQMVGKKMTIYDLVYEMITVSSNLATNILIDLVGAQHISQTMRKLGANDIQVLRGVEDSKAYQKGLNNTTTAYDLMLIFEKLATEKAGNNASATAMVEILLNQKYNDVIPVYLPPAVKVAHKTGFITGVHHDSGIVYLPDGRSYILILLSKNMKDSQKGTQMLAQVSKMVYDYMNH